MADIIEIDCVHHPGVELFASLTDARLRNRLNEEEGIFIAESPKVIRIALSAGYKPVSILCERKHIDGDASDIIKMCNNVSVYTGDSELLSSITDY